MRVTFLKNIVNINFNINYNSDDWKKSESLQIFAYNNI